MNFTANTNVLQKKFNYRIYLLQKLRNLNVNKDILQTFYRSFIESILTFSCMCWYGSLTMADKKRVDKVLNVCSKIVSESQASLSELYEHRCVQKAKSIMSDTTHVLSNKFVQKESNCRSGCKYVLPRYKKSRTTKSFIPMAIGVLYNYECH